MAQVTNVKTADGISWHVTQIGASSHKPHIVLIPSGEGDSDVYTGPGDECVATLLAQHFTVTTFDMPGFSRTTCPRSCLEDLSGHKIAAQIIGLLDNLGIEKTSVYGSSSGGILAMSLLYGWKDRIDRVVIHEIPLSTPEELVQVFKLKKDESDHAIVDFCIEVFKGMNADNLAAWEALGPEYHQRMEKNYVLWVRDYVGVVDRRDAGWHKDDGGGLDWSRVSWTIGGNSPAGWFDNNLVFGAKRGVQVGTLECVHFPQVSVPRVLATHIQNCCGVSD